MTYLSTEVDVWKKKFVSINHEFNECQEKLMMAEAELEALRKEKSSKVYSIILNYYSNLSSLLQWLDLQHKDNQEHKKVVSIKENDIKIWLINKLNNFQNPY